MTTKEKIKESYNTLSSIIIDFQGRAWRLCRVCKDYRLTEDSPIRCRKCGVEYGKIEPRMEVQNVQGIQ